MTPADEKDFETMTKTIFALMQAEITRKGNATPVILVRYPDGKIERLPFPEKAGALMNFGEAKDVIFGAVRKLVRHAGLTAVAFGAESWFGQTTEAGKAVPEKEFNAATRERGFQTAVDKGWVTREQCFTVILQTETDMRTVTQVFERDDTAHAVYYIGDRQIMTTPQSHFKGRQKMYGDLSEENLY
jgi:hypothetical protein